MECLFCKIASGQIKADRVFQNEDVVAFKDLNPVAPTHVLVIPKKHIESAQEINSTNSEIIAKIFETISMLAKKLNLDGFRVVNNCGESAGQTVKHLHFHLIAGRKFTWPPG